MKKSLCFIVTFILIIPYCQAQDKMNPDGYIGGVTLRIEPGFDYIGNAKTDYYIESNTFTQDLNVSNWNIKGTLLFPLDLKSSVFINLAIGKFKERGLGDKNFEDWETSYTHFFISGGFTFYFKSFLK